MELNDRTSHAIPAFTGIRAIAAYLVFLHHYNPAPVGTLANRLFHQGYMGVSVFFVLSGFLIYHRYANAYLEQINWSWRGYLQNRFAQIFPLYTLLLLATIGVRAQMGHPMGLQLVVLNLTLLQGFSETYKFSGIAQSWSLTVEVCFYLIAPFLFTALKRWDALPLTIGLIGLGLLLPVTIGQLAWNGLFVNLPFVLFYTFFGRSFEFITGMWLARYWQQNQLLYVPYAPFYGLLTMSGCVLWQTSVPQWIANPVLLTGSEVVVYNIVLPIGISLFFLGLLNANFSLRRVFSHSVVQSMGRSSYAFYLIHVGVVAHILQKAGIDNRCLLFGLLVLIAHALYIFIKKPLHRWLRTSKQPIIR